MRKGFAVAALRRGFIVAALCKRFMVEELCKVFVVWFRGNIGAAHHVYVYAYVFPLSSFNCDHFKVRFQHLCM